MDTDIKVTPYTLEDGRSANAKIFSWQSPTGAWAAEWDAETHMSIPLTDEDGDYIPVQK